ncbi:MAG: PucR family transcriptional regulator, partial [Eubacteriales bacterium]
MSNKLFQGLIYQMKDSADRIIGVVDEKGAVVACSNLSRIGEIRSDVVEEISYTFDSVTLGGYTYRAVGSHTRAEFIVFAEGEDNLAKSLASVISIALTNLKSLYDEKYDKANFIKNIILDNILPGDIYVKAKELRFDSEINRVVYLIRFLNKGDMVPFDIVQNLFPDKTRDYVISVSETDIVLVKELKTSAETKSVEAFAKAINDTASGEFY